MQILVIPPLIWMAVRFGSRETTIALLLLTMVATYGTASGYGPFAALSQVESMLLLQSFPIIPTVTALSLSATF